MATQQDQRNTPSELTVEWLHSVQSNIERLQAAVDSQRQLSTECAAHIHNLLGSMELRVSEKIAALETRGNASRTDGEADIYRELSVFKDSMQRWQLDVAQQLSSLNTRAGVWGVASGVVAVLIMVLISMFTK